MNKNIEGATGSKIDEVTASDWLFDWSCILEHEMGLFYVGGPGDWLDPDEFQGLACDAEIAPTADFESYCPEGCVFTTYAPSEDELEREVTVVLGGNPAIYAEWLGKLSSRKLLVIVPHQRFAEAFVALNGLNVMTHVGDAFLTRDGFAGPIETSRLANLKILWEESSRAKDANGSEESR